MASLTISDIKLSGLSVTVPKHIAYNIDYPGFNENEKRLFIKTTGIKERRIAAQGQTAADLCQIAAERLIKELNWEKEDIKVLLFVTQTPDYLIPATSCILQHSLGLSKHTIALDINLGCSGYVYGISVLASLLKLTKGKGLLLAGDISTATLSQNDKSTATIFSDAGSATAFEYDTASSEIYTVLNTDGAGAEAIMIPHGGMRHPFDKTSYLEKEEEQGIKRNCAHLRMKGVDVFNFSLREVPKSINELLEFAKVEKSDVDYFVLHQANLLMNESIRRKLQIPADKFPYSIGKYGNTSSVTIPLTIASELINTVSTKPLKLVLSGFGVGLSWGSMLIDTQPFLCTEIIEC